MVQHGSSPCPAGAGSPDERTLVFNVTVPSTNFRQDETLRVTLEAWGRSPSAGGPGILKIAYDPKDRDTGLGGDSVTSAFQANIPFDLQL